MTNDEFELRIAEARIRVSKLDDVDGFQDRELGTILAALECGLKNPDTGAHYDALVMLQDAREKAYQHTLN